MGKVTISINPCPSGFKILPAFEVKDQCSNDEKDEEKNKDNDTRADACLVVVSLLLCFAADLCPTLAEAERTWDWLVFDDHVSENGDDEQWAGLLDDQLEYL